ncbi:hypothetical protein PRUPE_6G198700 [Prunus persica]|uniref:GPI ethanolamine phosphate transferase 2 C-terminal domain-containing protein n=1 Tax=Prunus persica TaxID=3760 RepID=A0A251NSZ0_PRUPE|nr:hypothetical protein PRUPE_6G198700 [Prunus persica]
MPWLLTCSKLTLFTIAGVAIQMVGLSIFVFGFFPVKPTLPGHSGPESFQAPKCNSIQNETERDLHPHHLGSLYKVKDTVQVDQNVSRHLGHELNKDDWDFLILHYLGLDHVGHIGGRNSALMAPKLSEMDDVVKMIHMNSILNQKNDQGRTLLVVVSDHGMTESGNHGGSSYEETDSLALFIGLNNDISDYSSSTHNIIYQVDIAPTLALLFGVPIPKNNVGVLIAEIFGYLADDQQLKALELNSWQLLRLLQAQMPGLSCRNYLCDGFSDDQESKITKCSGSMGKMFCCLYTNAALLQNSWMSKEFSRSKSKEDYNSAVTAYYEFLRTASEWLSRSATDKPVSLLTLGIAAMLMSCLILLSLLFNMCKEVYIREKYLFDLESATQTWYLDETFVLGVILILIVSMVSSSMVEEEQYIWHFVASTLNLLLLRKAIQCPPCGGAQGLHTLSKEQNKISCFRLSSIFVVLVSGRILRGWHQGGVNWTNLPDISKWLEQAGTDNIKSIQLVSCLLLMTLSLYVLLLLGSNKKFVLVIGFSFLMSGLLVLQHVTKHQDGMFVSSSYSTTTLVQIIYATLGASTFGTVVALPWLVSFSISEMCSNQDLYMSTSAPNEVQNKSLMAKLRDSLYIIGWTYISCWCILQLLLQQTINSMPILLLLVQIFASMLYFSYSALHHKPWVEVAAFYFLGMAGHFALGNSNSLATIDVAGAFIGISSHSTVLSGILMFMITYASPMLFILSMVMYISVKETSYLPSPFSADSTQLLKIMLGFPCLVPLGLNSILLTAYTIILLLMRNHLFVWSVFSPKYIYVCTTTVCVYVGVSVVATTVTYTYLVLGFRRKMQGELSHQQ